MNGCRFRKFHPAQIRVVRQNHHIIRVDVCDSAWAPNVRRRHVQADIETAALMLAAGVSRWDHDPMSGA